MSVCVFVLVCLCQPICVYECVSPSSAAISSFSSTPSLLLVLVNSLSLPLTPLPSPSSLLPFLYPSPLPLFSSLFYVPHLSSSLLSSHPPLLFSPLRPSPLLSIPNYLPFLSSPQSIRTAVSERRGIYWSRSRGGLWKKGDTSGMHQVQDPWLCRVLVLLMWQSLSLPDTRSSSVTLTISLYLFPTYPPLSYRHQSTAISDTCHTHCYPSLLYPSLPYPSLPYPTSSYRSCSLLTLTAMEMPYASQ